MKYLIIIILFASCKTPEQLYNKAKIKDIVKVAELARIDFPCTTTKIDTTRSIDTLYDFIEVECPANDYAADSNEKKPTTPTKVKPNIKTVYVPRYVETVRIEKSKEDSAKIKIMYEEIQKAAAMIVAERKLTAEYKAEADEQRKAKNWWRKWCLITWGVIAVGIAFRLLRSKIGL
jgi:hypothetical protein